jgi:hypothetical protein
MRGFAGMKNSHIVRAALILGLILSATDFAKADTITLASVGTATNSGQFNSSGSTIAITPNASWASALAGSSWVSFGTTGNVSAPGFFVVPNGTVVSFFDVFNVPGIPASGSITVLADDSAAVYLNGVLLMSEAASAGNQYTTCSDFGVGCLVSTVIDLPASVLKSGSNTLQFDVAQRNAFSFGLDYLGSVIDPTSVPEPGVALLMSIGLVSIGGASLLRKPGRSPFPPKQLANDSLDHSGFSDNSFSKLQGDSAESGELDEFEIRRRAFFSA